MESSKKVLLSTIGIAVVIVVLVGVTFAFFNYTRTGSSNVVKVGRIYFNSEQGNSINLDNVFPIDKANIDTDTDNVGSVTIHVTGDTTYSNGIEYLVSAVNVNNTIGNKKVPISVDVSYEASNNKVIGTSDTDYFDNRGGDTSIYKKLSSKTISEGKRLLVGYIAPNQTGIDGTITIKSFIDKDRIAISDTYPEEIYVAINNNPSEVSINSCVTFFSSMNLPLQSGESYDSFCRGTGTIMGIRLQNIVNAGNYNSELLDMGILIEWTNGTTNEWVNGRTMLTTEQWNSLQDSGVSFQIKVEANEGIWVEKQKNAMNELAYNMFDSYEINSKIKEMYFVSMDSDEMHQRYDGANYKYDLSYNNEGEVLTWLETNEDDNTKYNMYVASDGITCLTTGSYFFGAYGYSYAEKIVFENVDTSRVTNMSHMFNDLDNLKELDIRSFDTSNVVQMDYFISKCDKLESINMAGLDLRKVQQMYFMFGYNTKLSELNTSGIITRDVTNMSSMFYGTYGLEVINLEGWGGDNLTSCNSLFASSNVTTTINMKDFNFGQVTNINSLFGGNTALETVDLSGVKMDNITNTSRMFYNNSSLNKIYVSSDIYFSSVNDSDDMFTGCTSLVGGNNTHYSVSNPTDKTYAIIDGTDNLPGYFTLKTN